MSLRDGRYVRSIMVDGPQPETYPFSIPCIKNLGELMFHPKVTYIVGENGTGKSTLIEALATACRFNPEGGNRNTIFSTHNTISSLSDHLIVNFNGNLLKEGFFFRAETMYNLFSKAEAEKKDQYGWHVYGWSDRHDASHGEGHLKLFLEKIHSGFLIFDEPESALSPEKQMAFLTLITDWIRNGCQIVICTHSPIILSYPESLIYSLDAEAPQVVSYQETQCVQTYDLFMKNRQRMVHELTK